MASRVVVCCVVLLLIACALSHANDPLPPHAMVEQEEADAVLQAIEAQRRGLKISDPVCLTVCDTSKRLMAHPEVAAKVHTRECGGGVRRMASCCACLDQGFDHDKAVARRDHYAGDGAAPQPAFIHLCIPTTPRLLEGKDVDFLNVMLKSLEEQVLDQHATGHDFAGVR